ncbi:hypothetical protein LQR30_18615 [Chromobacterium piscinae]|uniref:hypothetical protein n=1 Tax=Chromobacterium piscinae TaxID=686831 RepID=UPI001E3E546F|nr:hypothetical protein [Chromobacterium piscinae]MCD4506104.1 hypothetical protein [Chromobacterium piscinae]
MEWQLDVCPLFSVSAWSVQLRVLNYLFLPMLFGGALAWAGNATPQWIPDRLWQDDGADKQLHIGAWDDAVRQETIHQTICSPAWVASRQPSPGFVRREARHQFRREKLGGQLDDYVLDYVVPLALGGHPVDPANLRLTPKTEAAIKGREAQRLHEAVCGGRMSLDEVQARFLKGTWRYLDISAEAD